MMSAVCLEILNYLFQIVDIVDAGLWFGVSTSPFEFLVQIHGRISEHRVLGMEVSTIPEGWPTCASLVLDKQESYLSKYRIPHSSSSDVVSRSNYALSSERFYDPLH